MILAKNFTYHINIFEVKAQHRLAGFFQKMNAGQRSVLIILTCCSAQYFVKVTRTHLKNVNQGPWGKARGGEKVVYTSIHDSM